MAQLGFAMIDPDQPPVWAPSPARAPLPHPGSRRREPLPATPLATRELEQRQARARRAACTEFRLAPDGLEVLGLRREFEGMASTTTIAYRLGRDREWFLAGATSVILVDPLRWVTWEHAELDLEALEP